MKTLVYFYTFKPGYTRGEQLPIGEINVEVKESFEQTTSHPVLGCTELVTKELLTTEINGRVFVVRESCAIRNSKAEYECAVPQSMVNILRNFDLIAGKL